MPKAVRCAATELELTPTTGGRSDAQESDLIELQRIARVAVVAALVTPPDLVENGPVLCVFRRATGVPCPSCGLTRSWTATAHGRVRDGFRLHPLGPPALLGAAVLSVVPRPWLERVPNYPPGALPAFAAAWIGVWLGRLIGHPGRRSAD